jgi:hypothetical protein
MIDEETKADIRRRLNEAKADRSPMDATLLALHYSAESDDEHKELVRFICQEAQKTGASIKGCHSAARRS